MYCQYRSSTLSPAYYPKLIHEKYHKPAHPRLNNPITILALPDGPILSHIPRKPCARRATGEKYQITFTSKRLHARDPSNRLEPSMFC